MIGSEQARTRAERYEEILRSHAPALWRVAASYEADPHLRQDLFQEICLAIWRALPRLRGAAAPRTFLFRIAHNRGLSHGWRQGRLPEALSEPEALADRRPLPDAEAAGRQHREILLDAVRQLPLPLRQVLTLRLEGLSHREIAEVTGLTENNAMVRASRARTRLREMLKETE